MSQVIDLRTHQNFSGLKIYSSEHKIHPLKYNARILTRNAIYNFNIFSEAYILM